MTPAAVLANCQLAFEPVSHLDAGFEFLYVLNFDAAQGQFSDWKARYPDDPLGPAAAASAYLFQEFDRLGVPQSEFFSDVQAFQRRKKLTPDPHLKDRFDSELTLAEMLAARQLAKDVASVNALLAMTMANGLRADYAALIEPKDARRSLIRKRDENRPKNFSRLTPDVMTLTWLWAWKIIFGELSRYHCAGC